ncbi:MAG: penicillin-binding transpeptidase domain-containing protein [Clostridiales bacterium]|nr:penicillin-binding transpeptidase domain-containing protein [Clostridiales bacterium]
MAKRKKSGNHLGAVIAITVFLVIIFVAVAVLAWFFLFKEDSQAATQNVYDTYVQDVTQERYEAIYDLIHEDVAATVDKETVTNRYTNIFGGINAENVTFTLIGAEESENDTGWYYKYKMTMDTSAGTLDNTYSMQICKDSDDQYKIMWSSNLIFPQLDDTDTVRVNTLSAKRGSIYDVNGSVLARDGEGASVGFVPGKMSETTKDADIESLAKLLEVSVDYINEQLSASWVTDDVFVPVRSIAVDDQELIDQVIQIPGVMVNTTSAREYPYGQTLAHLTGYVQAISAEELETMEKDGYDSNSIVGKTGLEKLYESSLRGTDGSEILILNSDGSLKETLGYQAALDGKDVHLTLDANLCQILFSQLGDDKGLAVAMNMKTGAILSLVSTPSYNPNEFVAGITTSSWEALNNDERLPMYNRYTSTWVPGSVFKPVTAAIGLDKGTIDPGAVSQSNGLSWQKDSSWGSLFVTTLETYGDVTLQKALAYSDNIYFAQAALNLGRDSFIQGLTNLGFGENMPFTMELGTSTYGTLADSSDEILLANSGYGQGEMLVNPVHLASIYSAFMNDGNMLKPYLVSNSEELGGEAAAPGSFWKTGVFGAQTAQTINDDLRTVISEGTGTQALEAGVTLAGKTGTAEIKDSQQDTTGTELGWFAAYEIDNTNDPILILMMVEDVKERGGSHYVVPKVSEAFRIYRSGEVLEGDTAEE